MTTWNSDQYLKFEAQRTQPSRDLIARISGFAPKTALDLGCGPGNSTAVVQSAFPQASVLGIDNSDEMFARAKSTHPDLDFLLCDVHAISGTYDLIFSNACLQWVPDHESLLPYLMTKLSPRGILAVQMPRNGSEPLYQAIEEIAADPAWGFDKDRLGTFGTLTPHEYFNILSTCSSDFQIWETKYYHNLPDMQSLIEWVKGTRLRPYLSQLTPADAARFQQAVIDRAKPHYLATRTGEVLLGFRRFFFTAQR